MSQLNFKVIESVPYLLNTLYAISEFVKSLWIDNTIC